MNRLISTALLLLITIYMSACNNKLQVDLIVHHAKVYTVNADFSTEEAFAIKDGKFIAVGKNDDILKKYSGGKIVNAENRAIYPGFYDAHCHFFGLAAGMHQVNLVDVASMDELVARVIAFRSKYPDDAWIIGHGWDQNKWKNKEFPDNSRLNETFPNVPVFLERIDGHAALANDKALTIADVKADKYLAGGLVEQKNGKLTGILVDNAMNLVQEKIPSPTPEKMVTMLKEAEKACFSVGLTTLADAGLEKEQIELLHDLYRRKVLTIREYAMIMLNPSTLDQILKKGIFKSESLDIRSFKIVGDGALGSRGACLLQSYSDAPTNGFLLRSPQELDSAIKKIANSDFQLNVHAIGDSANRLILNTFNKYLKGKPNKRWRIEHAQVISPGDFEKFSLSSLIPSIQPTHATSDMNWALERLGSQRLKYAYAYKQLLKKAGKVALGSDFPVEDINPLYGFHAAVARTDKNNQPVGGFQIENALSREEALKGMTIWAAYACFQEDARGSIERNKLADFVVLENDIMQSPLNEIRNVKVNATYVGGEAVFKR
ncbi:amidohydrolase [Olivibacter domesticus]|uniref:Amidohydrolase 3 domain-containing protein n=1 Tax=Olivibacter domesticus TaxID=407022 RepID=A0A1H7IR03_OLID1|nr:amidohydrolase [Olivibacter domesticus]SEK64147.1 hypothetical protein SAMN05661044_00780 [Olivibacter domesticus]